MGRLARLWARPRPRLLSLRTTFAVSFAAVTAAVTVLVGVLSYSAAARLVRVDQESVFDQVVQDLRDEVSQQRMTPEDFSSSAPGHDLVRPARTDVQVLGSTGVVADPGRPGLPVTSGDRRIAAAGTAGRMVLHKEVSVGSDVYRIATVSLGAGTAPCRSPRSSVTPRICCGRFSSGRFCSWWRSWWAPGCSGGGWPGGSPGGW